MCASYYLHFAPFKNFSGRLDPSSSSNRTALLSHLVRFAVQHWRSYETTRLLDRASLAPQCEVRPGSSTAVGMGSLMARTLESRFAAVGLLENFSTSLVLFQLASGLSFAAGTHVHDKSASEILSESALNRTATLKQDALADSRMRGAVRDDEVVYAFFYVICNRLASTSIVTSLRQRKARPTKSTCGFCPGKGAPRDGGRRSLRRARRSHAAYGS